MCEDIHLEENRHSFMVEALKYSYVRLPKNQYDHGWVIVVLKKHVSELYELSPEERHGFMDEVSAVAEAVSKEFHAVKIYYSIFGALCPHLHMHILPKKESDDPHASIDFNKNMKVLPQEEYARMIAGLKNRLKVHDRD